MNRWPSTTQVPGARRSHGAACSLKGGVPRFERCRKLKKDENVKAALSFTKTQQYFHSHYSSSDDVDSHFLLCVTCTQQRGGGRGPQVRLPAQTWRVRTIGPCRCTVEPRHCLADRLMIGRFPSLCGTMAALFINGQTCQGLLASGCVSPKRGRGRVWRLLQAGATSCWNTQN